MTDTSQSAEPFRVAIAGGGVAALEAALALRDLGGDRFELTLICPAADFVYRPMAVREPFAFSRAKRYPIASIAEDLGVSLSADRVASIDQPRRVLRTESGHEVGYDAAVLALGARSIPRYEHAVTVDDASLDSLLHGLIEDVDGGYVHHIAYVAPPRMPWPLPIYELALMTAARAYAMNVRLAVTVLTPEPAPLAIFGDGASAAISRLLADAGITTITGAHCEVPDGRHVLPGPGQNELEVDRVVALPELVGPALRGLAAGEHGFIPIDTHCAVAGSERVFAAGDATDFSIKYGGIAAQQADTAALSIAALAGLPVEPLALHPVIHGMLLTGGAPLYLSAQITGGAGFRSEVTDAPTWSPPTKIAARHLAPYLDARDHEA